MLCGFPKILSELRRQKGISQKKAAEELGIAPSLLSHYENGIRECGLDFLLRLAEYYSVSCDYLLGKSTIKNPIAYETEPEAVVVDSVLKHAKENDKAAYELLCRIAGMDAYRMARALDDLSKAGSDFSVEEYRDLCTGATACLYAKLSGLPYHGDKIPAGETDVILRAEKELSGL